MGSADKILVRSVNWLGDAVMTTPALQRLREAKPKAHISLLTHAKLAGLWEQHPAINSVLTFSDDDSVFSIAKKLRTENLTTALVLPNSPRSALEVYLARIPVRVGLARPWRNFFLTQAVSPRRDEVRMHKRTPAEVQSLVADGVGAKQPLIPPSAHQLHHYLHLTAVLGANPAPLPPRLEVGAPEVAAVRKRFGVREDRTPLLGINAGAEYGPAKRWPRERFVAAAIEIQRRTNCQWWIFGGKADVELATGIAEDIAEAKSGAPDSVRSIAGQTTLRELCAALKACRLVITNDTGPMHVAAAVGTPLIVPFGSTSPELTGPGLPGAATHQLIKANVPCSPCFLRECPIDFRCMQGISVDMVVNAAMSVLGV
ncbi:MAG: lipopolysaccharide heptosyltransferase II [Verrucomicrobia bacterium]|nr:lipopolysaccharide heptosyltransferase II [Verrucomicrobiota bacterium]